MTSGSDELSKTIQLIRKAREGDAGAVDRLFERYSRVAVECARRLAGEAVRRKEEVEDLAQSALLEVWRDFGRFDYRGIGSLDRFVHHIVENKIKDKAEFWDAQRRNARLERNLNAPASDLSETGTIDLPSDDLSTTQVVSLHETQERVREGIKRLPEEHAAPLRLHFLEGLSLKEVADRLSLPSPDAARMRIQRARKEMKEILGGGEAG